MGDQTEIEYLDGDVVWVKLGNCWWPGEVISLEKLPSDALPSSRKPPIAIVKFFQEDTYEYVKNSNSIYKYNCTRKTEFIKKGLDTYRAKHGPMEKFPEDVIRAETATGGDIKILTRDEYQEKKKIKESYAGIFGTPAKKTPVPPTKKGRVGRRSSVSRAATPIRKVCMDKCDYKAHILVQDTKPSQLSQKVSTPSTSRIGSEHFEENPDADANNKPSITTESTTTVPSSTIASGVYSCHACPFTTTRLNVMILHNKTHSATYTPYIPSPVRKKPIKPSTKSTNNITLTPKTRRPRKDKNKKVKKPPQKRPAEEILNNVEGKKPKTNEEIKSSLLADWEDGDDESNDEPSVRVASGSPELPIASESPAVPTPNELLGAQIPFDISIDKEKSDSSHTNDKEPQDDSKYEFCEDEDWPIEADGGRKIPRVKNPSIRKEDTKSSSLDESEVAREVAELLSKTMVPELPSVPEPLNIEENFPEPPILKTPDKKSDSERVSKENTTDAQKSKPAIFKTKTFFRSRHSRSQDAIGKYVAEQLNAERLDILESDINGSEHASSPETRESPPVEPVKVARLAPKIQLKKMKAEAAQLREKEKNNLENYALDESVYQMSTNIFTESSVSEIVCSEEQETDNSKKNEASVSLHISEPKISETCAITEKIDKSKENADGKNAKELEPTYNDEVNMLANTDKSQEVEPKGAGLKVLDEPQDVDPVIEILDKPQETQPEVQAESEVKVLKKPQDIKLENKVLDTPQKVEPEVKALHKPQELTPLVKIPDQNPPTKQIDKYMTESTASAVDALLSVSRESDRVTRVISDDLPEDLFEDDNKDNINQSNGYKDNLSIDFISQSNSKDDCKEKESSQIENIDLKSTIHNKHIEHAYSSLLSSNQEFSNKANEDRVIKKSKTYLMQKEDNEVSDPTSKSEPSEYDLQIAETLISLPSTAIQGNINEKHTEIEPVLSGDSNNGTNINLIDETEVIPDNLVVQYANTIEIESPKNNCTPSKLHPMGENDENLNLRFDTEQENSENLSAAQSLVQMSESINHNINMSETKIGTDNNKLSNLSTFDMSHDNNQTKDTIEENVAKMSVENTNDVANEKSYSFETSSSKLLKILEEPSQSHILLPKNLEEPSQSHILLPNKITPTKQIVFPGKEKILNFDVNKPPIKGKIQGQPKQKIIIRRTVPKKHLCSNLNDPSQVSTPEIILSTDNKSTKEGSSVQTYSIKTTPEIATDANTIVIQPKIRKIAKTPTKLTKPKQQPSLVASVNEIKSVNEPSDAMFDINSMPVVLSDDILTPENIERMPIVMSDGNIITNPHKSQKTKSVIIEEKKAISPVPSKAEIKLTQKSDNMKTLLMNSIPEANKALTPNIISKSSKLRGAKPMLVIDKTTGKQKIIMTKSSESSAKEVNQPQTKIQSVPQTSKKTEKFIILPTASSNRAAGPSGRTQKIIIDPQTGKAHVLVPKNTETSLNATENKPISAKFIASAADTSNPGNTVMIITNAQGAQSRIVLTQEHEKILFPNKQQPNIAQLKTVTHRITTNAQQKPIVTTPSVTTSKTKIVPKQKSAIITSKGQLIVGGRVSASAQNIAPMPEIRPKRIVSAPEPKKLVQSVQKTNSEPLIFLQQKSGAVMQLTAAQFEHMQRTGQIVQKTPESKIVVQKSIPIPTVEPVATQVQKQRIKRPMSGSPTPAKRLKQEIAIAPAPSAVAPSPAVAQVPAPPLVSLSNTVVTSIISPVTSSTSSSTYPDLDNFEELLPSTAIVRQPDPIVAQPEPVAPPTPQAPLSDGQLIAIPGEHFGGPPASFYLCVEDNGTLTPIDNRPLVLENNQLVPMTVETLPVLAPQPERRDILEAALANSDVFHAESPRDEAPDFRDLNANVSVHCRVSETSTTLNQPIMTPVEVPSKADSEPAIPSNLEDGLAVIGVTSHTVPTSLELPITVTDPRIAPKTTDPLSGTNYGPTILTSPNREMPFMTTEEAGVSVVPISMPILTDDESVGKSMPILTDEVITERTASSVESTIGSPSSLDVRESETEDCSSQWSRRLLTPGSDISETSSEIPLQPSLQLSVNDLSRDT